MQLKKLLFRFSLKNYISLCLLLLAASIGFAQTEGDKSPQPQAVVEDHDSKELSSLIKKYNVNTEKVLDDASKLNQESGVEVVNESNVEEMPPTSILEDAENSAINKAKEELKKKQEEATLASQKGDFSLSVRLALEPLQSLTEEQLKQRFNELLKENPMRHYIEKFPELVTISVRLLKDKESIPSIVKIAADKDRLIHFVAIFLSTILLGFILKKLFHKEGRSFLGVIFFFILRVLILLGVRIYIVYYFFHVELTPAAMIIQQTLFP